ncbi:MULTISPECIES: amidase [Caulobacter]|jgi:amidase|uniref:Amidase, Asp-tRNAAsn/Glu-tRNAGln amidotransferase A subunit n=1 Tax=Caulobacter vibrioides OR37 TaxID=1292034 RepID=R0CXM9_CAUVI|nr:MULTISPECIES: amidase [Caulobacter]ENZ81211.1 amidase, Asp-tRNAAsn/Glu-tRNAGln amidotransferase A subunit [Caulobacter vibrioides OR37]MBQ1562531.1 amidase [Caulobacter sp.]
MTKFASLKSVRLAGAAAIALLAGAAQAQNSPPGAEMATEAYLRAIQEKNPVLHAVIAVNPHAKADARALDAERKAGKIRSPLHGAPILLKDNIESNDGTATTAGSLALKDNVPGRDAPLVKRLTDAGLVILGKTNLSEWANIRSNHSISGWSAVGGTVRNPYVLDRSACGSSSGSGAAVAAGLAHLAIGTETDGSITCPAAINGLVGLKPTVGLVSRTHIVPISHSQDTAGPMTTTVEDAAKVLTIIAGSDPADPATNDADAHKTDYAKGLSKDALKGVKLAVARFYTGYSPKTDAVFENALKDLRAQGAILVDVKDFDEAPIGKAEGLVLNTELKADMAAYLASTDPTKVKTRTLADLIAFNAAEPKEMVWFGQETFEKAEKTKGLSDPDYLKALADSKRLAGPEGIDRILKETGAAAIIAPTTGPAWTIDPLNGDNYGGSSTTLPAVAGYPHLTVPMGDVTGLPVGLSFIGPAWSEKLLLNLGYAYEQATHHRKPPAFRPTVAP